LVHVVHQSARLLAETREEPVIIYHSVWTTTRAFLIFLPAMIPAGLRQAGKPKHKLTVSE